MNTLKKFMLFVLLVVSVLSLGCAPLFNPKAGKNTYDVTDPFGGRTTGGCVVIDTYGNTDCTHTETPGAMPGYGYGAVGMGNPVMPNGYSRMPTPAYPEKTCFATQTGQMICDTDGVVPYVEQGGEVSPVATPNGRLDSRVGALEDQTRKTTRWARGADVCLRNGTCPRGNRK